MNLYYTLTTKTEANRYVKIYDGGWLVGMCYIDDEDLFVRSLNSEMFRREVKSMTLTNDKDFKDQIYKVHI